MKIRIIKVGTKYQPEIYNEKGKYWMGFCKEVCRWRSTDCPTQYWRRSTAMKLIKTTFDTIKYNGE